MKFTKIFLAALVMFVATVCANVGYCAKAPQYDADKAVLAYAEVYAFGASDNAQFAGLAQSDIDEVKQQLTAEFANGFKEFDLSDESIAKLTDVYIKKLQADMNIQVEVKEQNAKAPIVTLTANVLKSDDYENQANNDKNLQALVFSILGLKEEGKTDADLLVDPVFQKVSVGCITDFINGLSINQKATVDVKCKKHKGADKAVYWAPAKPAAVMNFVRGK